MENKTNNYSKVWIGVAATAAIILAVVFWKINTDKKINLQPEPQRAIAQKVTAGGKGETAHDLFPTELEMARKQGKGIMAYVCMENCKFCTKFVNETLSQPEVHDYLEERFIQVAVDLRDKENKAFFKKYEINAAPSALFFAADGTYLDESRGAVPTENFMEVAEGAWQMIEEGAVDIAPAAKLDAKVFPNPNNGNFNIQLNAADGPVEIKVLDRNGQVVYEDLQKDFTGNYEGTIQLPNPQAGTYYLKIMQGKQVETQRIIVQ